MMGAYIAVPEILALTLAAVQVCATADVTSAHYAPTTYTHWIGGYCAQPQFATSSTVLSDVAALAITPIDVVATQSIDVMSAFVTDWVTYSGAQLKSSYTAHPIIESIYSPAAIDLPMLYLHYNNAPMAFVYAHQINPMRLLDDSIGDGVGFTYYLRGYNSTTELFEYWSSVGVADVSGVAHLQAVRIVGITY